MWFGGPAVVLSVGGSGDLRPAMVSAKLPGAVKLLSAMLLGSLSRQSGRMLGAPSDPSILRHSVVWLLCPLVVSCSSPAAGRPEGERLAETRVIFGAKQSEMALRSLGQCDTAVVSGVTEVWSPSREAVDAIEQVLPAALERALERVWPSGSLHPRSNEYYRQYPGFVRNGRSVIYVNGFHGSYLEHMKATAAAFERNGESIPFSPDDWVRQAVMVCDAGTRQFGVDFDVSAGTLDSIRFSPGF
jgi:hypothetical protein